MSIEAMKMALEALEINLIFLRNVKPFKNQKDLASDCIAMTEDSITFLRKAIQKAEKQEPVDWNGSCVFGHCGSPSGCESSGCCRADSFKQEQGEPDWKALVLNHNADCESRCDMDKCGYKPYFEYSKRRCPNCPVHEMIDYD